MRKSNWGESLKNLGVSRMGNEILNRILFPYLNFDFKSLGRPPPTLTSPFVPPHSLFHLPRLPSLIWLHFARPFSSILNFANSFSLSAWRNLKSPSCFVESNFFFLSVIYNKIYIVSFNIKILITPKTSNLTPTTFYLTIINATTWTNANQVLQINERTNEATNG